MAMTHALFLPAMTPACGSLAAIRLRDRRLALVSAIA
jgi:hypothetical protein